MAFLILLGVLVGGFIFVALGKSIEGLITSLGGLGGVLALFFTRKQSSDRELE